MNTLSTAKRTLAPALVAGMGLLMGAGLTGCGPSGSGTSLSDAPEARELAPTMQEFDKYIVHYNAITSDAIAPEDAARYGIARSRSNALINIVLLAKDGTPGHTPVGGSVKARASNLTGQLKSVDLEQVTEGDAIYFIGVVPVANNETLNFDIEATPDGADAPLTLKFQQQFFTK